MSKLCKLVFIGYHFLDSLTRNQEKLFGVVNPAGVEGVLNSVLVGVVVSQFVKVVPCQPALSVFFNPVGVALLDEPYGAFGIPNPFAVIVDAGYCGDHEIEVVAAVVIFWFIL